MFYSQHIQSITVIVLWTNKNATKVIVVRNILKNPQNYDSFNS